MATMKVQPISEGYDYIVHPDGRAGANGGTISNKGTVAQAIQWAIDNCPDGDNILLAPGQFPAASIVALRNSNVYGSVEYRTGYCWDGASMTFKKATVAVPASRIVSSVNNINSFIFRRNDYKKPIIIAFLELDGGLSAADTVQSRALFGCIGLYNSENTTIDSCFLHNVTHTAVYAAHRSDPAKKQGGATVRNSEIGYCGLRYNKSYREYGTGIAGGGGGWDSGASSLLVENNYIHHCSMSAVNCEPGRNWLVQDNWLGCPWVYGLSESDKNKAPWAVTIRNWGGQETSKNVHRHNYVQTETGWAFVYNNKCKGNICKDNVIRHLKGAIVASGGASLSDQSITGNVDNGTKITSPNETLTGWTPDGEIDTPTSSTPEEPATVTAGRIGVNDQCVLAWILEGKVGQNRLFLGSTKLDPTTVMNAADVQDLARKTMAGLQELGVQLLRIGAGDRWSSNVQHSSWKNNPTRFYQVLDAYADAALEFGLQLVITCLGFADGAYDKDRVMLYDTGSREFADACAFVGDVARHFAGHGGVFCVEWANEPDHDHYAFNHWLPKYPDYVTRLVKYSTWVKAAVDLSAQLAGEGHAVITMGHALIGAMFCVETYHWSDADGMYVADTWNYSRNNKDYLKVPNDPCPVPSIHAYWFGASTADFTRDWITPFTSYCKGRAVTGLVGEHGDLRTAAAWYVKDLENVMVKAGLDSCAMRLAPRAGFPLASEPVVTDPQDDTPATEEPSDPSSPESEPSGQDTTPESPEEPSEPSMPATEGEEPGTDPPIIEEPASGDPSEPSEPNTSPEEPSSDGPKPRSESNILLRIVQWIFSLFRKE